MPNSHEFYCGLEASQLLRDAGFTWICDSLYGTDFRYKGRQIDEDEEYELKAAGKGHLIEKVLGGCVYCFNHHNDPKKDPYSWTRPSLSIAQRFILEKFQMHITIFSSSQESWMYRITKPHQTLEEGLYGEDFPTFQAAQEAAIVRALKEHLANQAK